MDATTQTTNPLAIKYGDIELDFSALPQTSLVAMLRRGVAHYFGSEQASKVVNMFTPGKDKEGNALPLEVEDTPDNRAKAKSDFQAKALDALIAGTVGVSMRGPAVDPITTIINNLTKKEVVTTLKQNGVRLPKKAEEPVVFPDGRKLTISELMARRLNPTIPAGIDSKGEFGPKGQPHIDRLKKEAEKIAREQAAKIKKIEEAGKDALSDM